jgi:hypothetical protein
LELDLGVFPFGLADGDNFSWTSVIGGLLKRRMISPAPIFTIPTEPPRTQLPVGSVLALPSGFVEVQDDGHLFIFSHQWVGAIGLSDRVFLVARERESRFMESRCYHELLGYLVACGCEVWPVDFRCPVTWRQKGSFESVRRLWVERFFEEGDRLLFKVPLPLSEQPTVTFPLTDIAADATMFWVAAGSVAEAMFAADRPPEPELLAKLMRLSHQWERAWNSLLTRARDEDLMDRWGWLPKCDQAWADVVRSHLEANGYRMQPESTARLL